MKRVTGIGGVFFKAQDPVALRAWYKNHLGVDVQPWGGAVFDWADADGQPVAGATAWTISADNAQEYAPGTSRFMINYRVADLDALLLALREEGCNVVEVGEPSEFGKFAWLLDPEGNKVELWEPMPGQ